MLSGSIPENQSPQLSAVWDALFIRPISNRLGAIAVRKIALVTQSAVMPIHIIYEPMERELASLGCEL